MKTYNPERSEYLKYFDFLIASGAMSDALALWDDFVKSSMTPKTIKPVGFSGTAILNCLLRTAGLTGRSES